ncbi:hypothetical protein SAMN03159496_04682 [Rhizobium sp. NFR07]|uniref:hypothetical protein n=1 Tax=Rhizobium sp. NFR07 TaxID=1566262 RepID=UPI0008EE2485|nr:hypothetical protein [Rhizobium sp. NFR07]SFB52693.1 hypothetical protein SAMN03159496_04682 [Rhizobium sp. NFR07]
MNDTTNKGAASAALIPAQRGTRSMSKIPANDNTPLADPLGHLPMFATDQQLAVAIVGRTRSAMWVKTVIPQLERKGFPRIDPLHDGRPVPLVKKFYDGYFGITAGFSAAAPDGEERLGEWKKSRRRA